MVGAATINRLYVRKIHPFICQQEVFLHPLLTWPFDVEHSPFVHVALVSGAEQVAFEQWSLVQLLFDNGSFPPKINCEVLSEIFSYPDCVRPSTP